MDGMSHNALHNPVIIDYVSRDGRVQERELLSATLDLPLIMPLDLAHLDGYSASVRRSQLVEVLASCARRSVARANALRLAPFLQPIAAAAQMCRSVQLALSGALCVLISLEVAPGAGCGAACWAAEALGALYAGLAAILLVDGSLEAAAGQLSALCMPSKWPRLAHSLPTAAHKVREQPIAAHLG